MPSAAKLWVPNRNLRWEVSPGRLVFMVKVLVTPPPDTLSEWKDVNCCSGARAVSSMNCTEPLAFEYTWFMNHRWKEAAAGVARTIPATTSKAADNFCCNRDMGLPPVGKQLRERPYSD